MYNFFLLERIVYYFLKLDLLRAYNAIHKSDKIFLFKTFLNSLYAKDSDLLNLPCYQLVRPDHPSYMLKGGVCIFFTKTLPICFLNLPNLKEFLFCEIRLGSKCIFIVSLYISPIQSREEFIEFMNEFEQVLWHITNLDPYMIILNGDFQCKT